MLYQKIYLCANWDFLHTCEMIIKLIDFVRLVISHVFCYKLQHRRRKCGLLINKQ